MAGKSFWHGLQGLLSLKKGQGERSQKPDRKEKGILAFASTSEVIRAERLLKNVGLEVEVMGPPPELQTGCDMVVVFPLMRQAEVENLLGEASIPPERILAATDLLLEPVSLCHVKDLGEWLMARAANMKMTIDKKTSVIVNISGGGCPDVPMLAQLLVGQRLQDAPEPISLGHTLCCYCLQKAYEKIKEVLDVADSRHCARK